MKNYTFILVISWLLLAFNLQSQDVIFSQYINTPLLVNPSYTGDFDGNKRVITGYKDQWRTALSSAAYKAGILTYDSKINLKNNRTIGYGASTAIDRAGSANYGSNIFKGHLSTSQRFGEEDENHHLIAVGIEMGVSNVGFSQKNRNYFDFGSGVSWKYKTVNRFGIQLGTAIFHINRPNISLTSGNIPLYSRYNINGQLNLPLLKRFEISPTFLSSFQGPHQENLVGINSKYLFTPLENRNPGSILFGIYSRVGKDLTDSWVMNSINFISSFESRRLTIGLSYDHFFNGFGGTFECVVGYKFHRKSAE